MEGSRSQPWVDPEAFFFLFFFFYYTLDGENKAA